jgi:hypothetical protein
VYQEINKRRGGWKGAEADAWHLQKDFRPGGRFYSPDPRVARENYRTWEKSDPYGTNALVQELVRLLRQLEAQGAKIPFTFRHILQLANKGAFDHLGSAPPQHPPP